MDFGISYTEEQERFREEVRDWLESNIPDSMKRPIGKADLTEEQYWFWRQKHKEMAAKGWLYPTSPKEYGGGGLSPEHETILLEEFLHHGIHTAEGGSGPLNNPAMVSVLLVWGTEEQKRKFIPPLFSGEKTSWYKLTEPKGGADLANYQSRAVRDGDDWLLSGSNVFITGVGSPDYLNGPMLTDPDAPRHRNLGYFIIPVPSPGLEIRELNLLSGKEQHFVFMDNVRVPADHLIGGDHEGWQVVNTSLEPNQGRAGRAFGTSEEVDHLVSFMQRESQQEERPELNSVRQQDTLAAYIDAHINMLFQKQAYWKHQEGIEMTYEGALNDLFNRLSELRIASRVRDVMGLYALLGTKEPRAADGGAQEANQRYAFVRQHGHGSLNISRVVVARRMGISRTKVRPAPIPASVTKRGS